MNGHGQGRIFLRGRNFWIASCCRGVEFRQAAKDERGQNTSDHKVAARFLKRRMAEVGADKLGLQKFTTPKADKLTVADLIEALKADFTLRDILSEQNKSNIGRVTADFGTKRAVEVSPATIDEYVSQRLADGDKPASINRTTQLLGQAYKLAVRRGELTRVPYIRHLSEAGNARQGFFTEAELAAVIEHLPEDLRDYTRFAAATGMRKSEIASLKWSDVDGDVLKLRGENSKNGSARLIPLTGELGEIITRRAAVRPMEVNSTTQLCEFIFHRGGRQVNRFNKAWATACEKANVSGKLFHDLRRLAVRSMVQAGVSPQVAKKISGHKTDSMFQRYSIIVTDDVRAALEQTEAYRKVQAAAKPKVAAMR